MIQEKQNRIVRLGAGSRRAFSFHPVRILIYILSLGVILSGLSVAWGILSWLGYVESNDERGAIELLCWFSGSVVLFLIGGIVAHFSRALHVRLNAPGLLAAFSALLMWQVAAICLLFWRTGINTFGSRWWISFPVIFFGVYVMKRGARAFAWARRKMARTADEVIQRSRKPPILYLRSFRSDLALAAPEYTKGEENPIRGGIFSISFWTDGRALTSEEVICRSMKAIGPVIAIGEPGEKLPKLGAYRKYFSHEDWKEGVASLVDTAGLCLVLVGGTAGVRWECEYILSSKHREKMVLLLPADQLQAQDAWLGFLQGFTMGLKGDLPSSIPSDALAIIFRPDGRTVTFTGRPRCGNYVEIVKIALAR